MCDLGLFQKYANIVKKQDAEEYQYGLISGNTLNEIRAAVEILGQKTKREKIFYHSFKKHVLMTSM